MRKRRSKSLRAALDVPTRPNERGAGNTARRGERAARDLQIISDMPSPAAGAAGALDRGAPRPDADLPPPLPALQLQVNL